MSTSPVVPTAPTTGTTTGLPSGQSLNNMFLQLLVAQLQNQDPTSPVDPSQFVGQLAQFSELSEVTSIYTLLQGFVPATGTTGATVDPHRRRELSSTSGAAAAMLAANSALTSIPSSPISSSATKSAATTLSTFASPSISALTGATAGAIPARSKERSKCLIFLFHSPDSRAESTALSAIANNLSNQNTTGYKDTSVLFSDLFYQSLGTTGAGDPIQVGAGVEVGSMPSLFTQGSISSTGVPTDVAIQGDGFFRGSRFQWRDRLHAGGGLFHRREQFPGELHRATGTGLPGGEWGGEHRGGHCAAATGSGDQFIRRRPRPTWT